MTDAPPVVPAPPPQIIQVVQPAKTAPTKPAAKATPAPLVPPRHRGPAAAVAGGVLGVAGLAGWLAAGPAGLGIAAGVTAAGVGGVAHLRRQRAQAADPAVAAARKVAAKALRQADARRPRFGMPGLRRPERQGTPGRTAAPLTGGRPGPAGGPGGGRSGGSRLFGRRGLAAGSAGRRSVGSAGSPARPVGQRPGAGASSGHSAPPRRGMRGALARLTPAGRRQATAARRAAGSAQRSPGQRPAAGSSQGQPSAQPRRSRLNPFRRPPASGASGRTSGRRGTPGGAVGGTSDAGPAGASGRASTGRPSRRHHSRPNPGTSGTSGGSAARAPRRGGQTGGAPATGGVPQRGSVVRKGRPSWPSHRAQTRRASEDAAARKAAADAAKAAPKGSAERPDTAPRMAKDSAHTPAPGAEFGPPGVGAEVWVNRKALADAAAEMDRADGKPPLRDMPKTVNGGAGEVPTRYRRGEPARGQRPAAHHETSLRDMAERRAQRQTGRDAGKPPTGVPAAPPVQPARSRRAELGDSQWPEGGRHRARGGAGMTRPIRSEDYPGQRSGLGAAGGFARGGSDIQDMQTDFPRVVHQGRQAVEDAVAGLRQHVSSIVDGSPSNAAVKEAAEAWAADLERLAGRGDDIIALSRQADAAGYAAAEQYEGDPNRGAWMGQG